MTTLKLTRSNEAKLWDSLAIATDVADLLATHAKAAKLTRESHGQIVANLRVDIAEALALINQIEDGLK